MNALPSGLKLNKHLKCLCITHIKLYFLFQIILFENWLDMRQEVSETNDQNMNVYNLPYLIFQHKKLCHFCHI